jgi:hypothetical protein
MKKLLCFVAVAFLVMGLATSAFGAYATTDMFDTKYVITNTSTTLGLTTIIPSTIISGDATYHLLRVTVGHAGKGASYGEAYVGIYDATNPEHAVIGNLECELEAGSGLYGAPVVEKVWTKPLKIYNGVIVVQGCSSIVQIEYERRVP